MERFLLRHLSNVPGFAALWTDLSPANVAVTTVAVITSHVIEMVRRSGVLEIVVCNIVKKEPTRYESVRAARSGGFCRF